MTPSSPIRVIVADNHSVVRLGLVRLFSLMDDIEVIAEASDVPELLDHLRQITEASLLLMDLNLPYANKSSLITRLRVAKPDLPILIFALDNQPTFAKWVLQMGAAGILTKGCSLNTLIIAIRRIAAGGRFIDPEIAGDLLIDKPPAARSAAHDILTDRELHILKLIARGVTGNEIARNLDISKKTVSTHKRNLMQKMHFDNIADLILYAVSNSLME